MQFRLFVQRKHRFFIHFFRFPHFGAAGSRFILLISHIVSCLFLLIFLVIVIVFTQYFFCSPSICLVKLLSAATFSRAGISAFGNVCSMQVCLSLFILPKAKHPAGMSAHSGRVYLIYLHRKRYSVFSRYTAPARSTTLGNSGCSIAFGKCWVSRQKPSRL